MGAHGIDVVNNRMQCCTCFSGLRNKKDNIINDDINNAKMMTPDVIRTMQ